ncbi:ABC transporter ATP-binding protein [Tropicimonas sediminicola]|uniref:Branched-chain amino acid transport system ATP-binding protein n=1 Tax=Tropicimonas sediminicola TaxID=1031541 RepID=A0A239ME28_9RHOB|nr:ABC transporter ATP-binding protein [Tropicimonas sediminicola]SNT40750.1 branched-chain amino acid transport system ATP-binding protein [Tropicimonas sediminicola]
MTQLILEHLSAGYGGADIVHDVSLQVGSGEIVTLVGPNGAGKSTLLKSLAGVARVTAGSLSIDGTDLVALSPFERATRGVAFMPQDRNVFRTLTVTENLETSAWGHDDIAARKDEVIGLLPTLANYLNKAAGGLSGGQRQMAALGMTLMSRPSILLVDEPTAGLSPNLVGEMLDVLQQLTRDSGIGILIVEQNARAALARADRAVVLVDGRLRRAGPAAELAAEPDFGALFFGDHA